MIRICIGISKLTPGWTVLFQQIGIEFEEIDFNKNIDSNYSVLIINSNLERSELREIEHYIKSSSGGVLIVKKLIGNPFKDVVSINTPTSLPQEYSHHVHFFRLKKGLITEFGFDPSEAISNYRFIRKRFPFRTTEHPDEIVSSVDKKAVLDSLDVVLRTLHTHRDLPYITKWHSPTVKPVFGFRIDSDFGDQDSIISLYELGKKHSIPMTWFLHVQAHEDWLTLFHSFQNQEIALHGYEHGTSKSYEQVINNIERGKQLMIDAGLHPKGFSVPYGIWNDALAEVLYEFEFAYSSEFTIGYDTLPFYPIYKGEIHPTLQIPIHPICTGSLNRKKISEQEMEFYFQTVLNEKLKRNENVFFYHHPMQIGLNVWESVFNQVNIENLTKLTFVEYSKFWEHRLNATIKAEFNPETKELRCESSLSSLWLKLSHNDSNYYLIEASKANRPITSYESFEFIDFPELSNKTLNELKGNRLQLLKTSILDWRNRKRL